MINSPKATTVSVTQTNSLHSTSELTFLCMCVQTWPSHMLFNPVNRRNTSISKQVFQSWLHPAGRCYWSYWMLWSITLIYMKVLPVSMVSSTPWPHILSGACG